MENAYDKIRQPIPWDFRNEGCVRTLTSFNPQLKKNFLSTGTAYNALSDCYYQVGYCSEIWKSLHSIKT